MANSRILLDSGEFVNPEAAKNRTAGSVDPKQIELWKSEKEQAVRQKAAAEAQVVRLQAEYNDLKKAYDTIWAELNGLKEASKPASKK